jgi:fatty-acyl-CoA synthase
LFAAADAGGMLVFHLDDEVVTLTAAELAVQARSAAEYLVQHGVRPGDRVGLLGRNRPEWAVWAFATWLSGAALVPLQLPVRIMDRQAFADRIDSLVAAADCRRVVVEPEFAWSVDSALACDWSSRATTVNLRLPDVAGSDVAVTQFTSGSTSNPRGVLVTHFAVLAQLDAQREALGAADQEIALGWVPFFHDLGLVFFLLHPLLQLSAGHILPTERFARDPGEWLRLVAVVGATVTDAPASAWAAALEAARRAGSVLDLSSLRVAYFAGEAVDPDFAEEIMRLAPEIGLDVCALGSTYGLAEAVLGVSAAVRGSGLRILDFDSDALARHGRVMRPSASRGRLVSAGPPSKGTSVRIVDSDDHDVGNDVEGAIQVTGASLMSGYLDKDSTDGFCGEWVRTGDLGFLHDGELYVTGRAKDVLIVSGHNYYPEDFEWAASRVPGVRAGRSAAFTVDSGSRIVLLVEPTGVEARERLSRHILRAVADAVGPVPAEVHLVPPGAMPKTTSGKIRRQAARALYEAGWLPLLT